MEVWYMNLKDFASLNIQDFRTKSAREIYETVKAGARILNPRINKLLSAGVEIGKIPSDAYDFVMKSGGLFTTLRDRPFITNGVYDYTMTRDELIKELGREIRFSRMKTATVSGAREERKRRQSIVYQVYNEGELAEVVKTLDPDELNQLTADLWKEFHRFRERHLNFKSDQLLEVYTTSGRNSDVMESAIEKLNLERQEEEERQIEEAQKRARYNSPWRI